MIKNEPRGLFIDNFTETACEWLSKAWSMVKSFFAYLICGAIITAAAALSIPVMVVGIGVGCISLLVDVIGEYVLLAGGFVSAFFAGVMLGECVMLIVATPLTALPAALPLAISYVLLSVILYGIGCKLISAYFSPKPTVKKELVDITNGDIEPEVVNNEVAEGELVGA